MNFESLGLSAPILRALAACDYHEPTPIQEQAIPPALEGRDVLGCAQTGTGKTCAFGTPILQLLAAKPRVGKGVRALILTPTRELALQIHENLKEYSRHLPLRTAVIFGGVGQVPQVEQLKRGVDVLTATPGRLLDLNNQGLIDLKQVEIFVLDEADRMLDMGFIHDVKKILAVLPKKKQTLFFSATMPEEITELVNSLMENPVRVAVNPVSSPVERIEQKLYMVDRPNKTRLLAQILKEQKVKNALVFARTKHGADKVTKELVREGVRAAAIHGNKSQTARQAALAQFKSGAMQVLVATDIAARGIDIEDLSHVFNYNLPEVPETYIHRIGRTGRAGRGGEAIAFCDYSEEPLLRGIETLLGKTLPRVQGHDFPMEDFTKVRRDGKGRVINLDDEEARQAAREKRSDKQRVDREKKPFQKEAAHEKPASPIARNRRRPTGGSSSALPAHPVDMPRSVSRRNPLDGDVIMDATARMLAGRAPKSPVKQPEKQPQRKAAPAQPQATEGRPADRNQHRHPKQQTGSAAAHLADKLAKQVSGKSPRPSTPQNNDTRGRGTRRRIPTVEGPKSRQKDSTEQASLMKPFYLDHD